MNSTEATLAQVQRWMLDALLAPGSVDGQLLADIVLRGPRLGAAASLAIYQRSYLLRLRLCLGEQFPATRHALGKILFDDFADEYLRAVPSRSYTLHELGRRFPDWLEQARPDGALHGDQREDWIDFMVDLAQYERGLFRLFDAPGHEGRPWPGVETGDGALILQPCLRLEQYRWPVAGYYHAVRAGCSPELPTKSRSYFVIARRDHQTTTYPVSPLHHRFLRALQQHGSIERALADIAAWTQRPLAAVVHSWVTEVRRPWLEAGFFIARAALSG
jgi:hypothetical protein